LTLFSYLREKKVRYCLIDCSQLGRTSSTLVLVSPYHPNTICCNYLNSNSIYDAFYCHFIFIKSSTVSLLPRRIFLLLHMVRFDSHCIRYCRWCCICIQNSSSSAAIILVGCICGILTGHKKALYTSFDQSTKKVLSAYCFKPLTSKYSKIHSNCSNNTELVSVDTILVIWAIQFHLQKKLDLFMLLKGWRHLVSAWTRDAHQHTLKFDA
jgi:hypothetical protein